jgi:SAM-dependent methyltransferase
MNLKTFARTIRLKYQYGIDLNIYVNSFKNKEVLEIGGPSRIFNNEEGRFIPLYNNVKELSNINFSFQTIWENEITEGETFSYGNRRGKQYVLEASDLNIIKDNTFDGLVSSHCLEHTANPIKVIFEWKRVIKNSGHILILLPNKKYTFDHKRPDTTFEHLLSDYTNQVTEEDLTHLEEIIELHDRQRDIEIPDKDFKERSLNNFKNRCFHHHVFNDNLMIEIAKYTDLELIQKNTFGLHLIYLLKKN